MPKLTDWKPGDMIRCLVYGKAKTGKTFGAGTFPRPNFLCFDPSGIATLAGRDFVTKHRDKMAAVQYEVFVEKSRNNVGVITNHNAQDDASRYFDECMKPAGKWKGLPVGRDTFDTWVLDSATTLSEAAMNKAIMLLGGSGFGIASKTHKQALATGLVFPKIQDYGSERSMVEQFIQMLLDTDKHVVVLCHEKEVSNDEGTLTAITPLLTGKGVEAIGLKFDEIWNLRARKVGPEIKRELMTYTDGIRMAGTRYGVSNGTEWAYDAVAAQLNEIHKMQTSALTQA